MIANALPNVLPCGEGDVACLSDVAGRASMTTVLLARITNLPKKIYDIVEGPVASRLARQNTWRSLVQVAAGDGIRQFPAAAGDAGFDGGHLVVAG